MPHVSATSRDGRQRRLEAALGHSLMEAFRAAGVDEVLALCGGTCSCATCHVYVDPTWLAALEPPSDDEDALLEGSAHRTPRSRLSCQIRMIPALDGLSVTIAPED